MTLIRGRGMTRAGGSNRRRDRQSGQALVELAIITPIIILLILGIFQFAIVFEGQSGLTNAVREAARRGAANPDETPVVLGAGGLEGAIQKELCGDLIPPCSGGLLAQNVPNFTASRLTTDPPNVTFCTYPVMTSSGTINNYQVNVDLGYNHPEFFPLAEIAAVAAGNPSSGSWHWFGTASAQMRLESIDDVTASASITAVCP